MNFESGSGMANYQSQVNTLEGYCTKNYRLKMRNNGFDFTNIREITYHKSCSFPDIRTQVIPQNDLSLHLFNLQYVLFVYSANKIL